jgi:hypothetical protein
MPDNNNQKRTAKGRKDIRSLPGVSPMPPERAFVVQFRGASQSASGWFSGRVEHMLSGQNANFVTPPELLAFFGRVMNQKVRQSKLTISKKGSIQ